MRGKGFFLPLCCGLSRITPAYAGKRDHYLYSRGGFWDHPRVCGEKDENGKVKDAKKGSPPRMRGKGSDEILVCQELRITPAYAGKSPSICLPALQCWDHPRVCGEKSDFAAAAHPALGSPPRMRGKGSDEILVCQELRITPAYAGKRLKRSRSTVPHAAIVPLFPSVCNKPAGSDGSPAGHDAPPFLPIENAAPASPAYNLRSL